jgi:hypothetical protein
MYHRCVLAWSLVREHWPNCRRAEKSVWAGPTLKKRKIKKPKMAHAKTRPSLWLEGFPILSVVHPHNRTLAGLLPPAAENYIVYYRGRNQTSHSILASITPRRRNRQCNRIQGCCITFGQVTSRCISSVRSSQISRVEVWDTLT